MKHYYICTGYSKAADKLSTHTYYELWPIVALINQLAGKEIVNEKDLDFDVKSRASHKGAQIIDDGGNFFWSIYYV